MARPLTKIAAKVTTDKKDLLTDWYDVDSRQVPQDQAGYNPIGMNGDMACANCHWFVSPNSCMLVSGDISPTGLSKLWMKPVEQPQSPMPVTIMDPQEPDENDPGVSMPLMGKSVEGNIVKSVIDGVKSLLNPNITDTATFGNGPMRFFKGSDGAPLRFIMTVSNNFKDREAEIITEEAHKEFVEYATLTGNYPELWLWHLGAKSKWGMADWLDVCDGFLVASGTVDKGKEHIAKALAKDEDVGISHGFYKSAQDGVINRYRTFELSPLPMWAAANEWTSYTLTGEDFMPFTTEKKNWLVSKGMSTAEVTAFEEGLNGFAKELKARGIDFKDFTPTDSGVAVATKPSTVAAPVVENTATVVTEPVKEEVKETSTPTLGAIVTKDVAALDTRITGLEASIKSLTDAFTVGIQKLSKSQDAQVADFFTAATAQLPKGFRASESADNTPAANGVAKELAERDLKEKEGSWFREIVVGGMGK